jgi:hypothetical protein
MKGETGKVQDLQTAISVNFLADASLAIPALLTGSSKTCQQINTWPKTTKIKEKNFQNPK